MEIVSEPDMSSPQEAAEYVKKLRNILRFIGTCDGNMEKGNLRADVNVSVRKKGDELGTRCEIKNVNSIKFIQQAIEFEAKRQVDLIEKGEKVIQETRLFDPSNFETRSMRSKEESHDYRYFPDPDLPPLVLNEEDIEKLRLKLPELPDQKKLRFIEEFRISAYDAEILVTEKYVADFFEQIVKGRDPKIVISWLTVELFSYLKKKNISLEESKIDPKKISSLIDLIISNKISNRQAKEIFDEYLETDINADTFIEKKGLVQISNESEIEDLVEKVLKENPKMLEQFKSGKEKLFGFFVGQAMKLSNGKANPKMVNETLKRKLSP
jgi:aspartyl-tRNA(Asn)/glutamyl-tRNA(Gln) amidotransferase subunit B